jgi:hypothetical protein
MAAKRTSSLGLIVHQDFYVGVEQVGGSNPKPAQRFGKEAFLHWAARQQGRDPRGLQKSPRVLLAA